ncbi:uncharacterized protein LOC135383183 isoform X3 [Ornithodoros turicata]|uniref:uncharacterized protein LOC135383183 isoform X3 n=1 Tax=Ornithodoros turicata TaxID=34597 RepID=UPI003139BD9B
MWNCFVQRHLRPFKTQPQCYSFRGPLGGSESMQFTHFCLILQYEGSLLSCSYMCAPAKSTSCYQVEKEGSSCLRFDPPPYGRCFGGVCYPQSEYQKVTMGKKLKKTLDCGAGHDYLYNSYGPFGCKYYCAEGGTHANRPDGIKCLMPQASRKGKCDGYGYCVDIR